MYVKVLSSDKLPSLKTFPVVEILRISLIETETESVKESNGDIDISVVVIANVYYGDWGSKWNSIAQVLIIAFTSTYCTILAFYGSYEEGETY